MISHMISFLSLYQTNFTKTFQAISMEIQRGNVHYVQGAYGELAFEELDEIFYIVKPNNIF